MLDSLLAAGIHTIFGNPGTTELPLIAALAKRPQLHYSLVLHEATAVAAATGHALATGQPAVALVHAMPGLGNALSMFANAARCGAPVVLIAGNQDRRHQHQDPIVHADLVDITRSVAKHVWEARTAAEVPAVTARAIEEAMKPPAGAVFLSVPMDLWSMPASQPKPRARARTTPLPAAPRQAVDALCDLLAEADSPVFVTGDLAALRDVGASAAELAGLLGAAVHWAPVASLASFPSSSDWFRGPLLANAASYQRSFASADLVLGIGAELTPPILHEPGDLIPATARRASITESPADRVGILAPELCLHGDLPATLDRVLKTMRRRLRKAPARIAKRRERQQATGQAIREKLRARATATPQPDGALSPPAAISAILDAVPHDAIVVDEAVSSSGWIPLLGDFSDSRSYLSLARGGALGYGLGAALGARMGTRRPTVVVVGDGALTYTPQSLWSIVAEGQPIVTCVLNNGRYQILQDFLESDYFQPRAEPGASRHATPASLTRSLLTINDPPLDFAAIAKGFGVRAARVDSVESCRRAVSAGFESGQAWLIDIPVRRPPRSE